MNLNIERIAESFVKKSIKFRGTTSSGEGKLYISAKNDKSSIDFFKSFDPGNKYKFDKGNFIEYLHSVKFEYIYQVFHEYIFADRNYWQTGLDTLKLFPEEKTYFTAAPQEDASRLYIANPDKDNIFYELFRGYALPDITRVEVTREEENGSTVFIFRLYLRTDLKRTGQSEQEQEQEQDTETSQQEITAPYNRIVYGAPGTGKSYKLETESEVFGMRKTRVTFHPDYSYAKFLGSYKPKTYYKFSPGAVFHQSKSSGTPDTAILNEPVIDYTFTPGPFLQALIEAYKSSDPYLLIIEEINRANTAAIFGEVFQLLDRKDGRSIYKVMLSEEAMQYIKTQLPESSKSKLDEGVYIPGNLYIWATMNSADQGVFNMDAAFKRRWHFEYLPLNENEAGCEHIRITFCGRNYDWNTFRKLINTSLIEKKVPEDRLIGPFFMNSNELSDDGAIKNKLLLYLRDDVLRHNHRHFFKYDTFSEIIENYSKGAEILTPELHQRLIGIELP